MCLTSVAWSLGKVSALLVIFQATDSAQRVKVNKLLRVSRS
jgi:hypothetical protein